MRAFADLVVRRPRAVLLAGLLLTLAAVYALASVTFDNSTERLLVRDSDAWHFLTDTRRAFGGDETLFVLLRAPDVLASDVVARLQRITAAVRRVPGVERTVSLATLHWPWPENGDVVVSPLFTDDGVPTPGAPVAAAVSHPLVAANLVSRDRHVTGVLALVSPRPEDPRFKGRLVADVERAVAEAAPGAAVMLGGAPPAQVALNQLTGRDLRVLGPVALAVMAVILFLTYRSAHGVWLPLTAVVLSFVWTIALAAVLGRSLSIVTSVLPPLILAIGTSYTIRVLSEYNRQRELVAERAAALRATLCEVGLTVLVCGATTALGFAALLTSRVEVIRDLGLLATCGAAFTTLAALTIVPAALAVLPARRAGRGPSRIEQRLATDLLPCLHALTVRRARPILGGALVLTTVGLGGLALLVVDQDPYAWFPTDSAVARSTRVIDQQLGGVIPLSVVLESPSGVYDPDLYRGADAVARWARAQPETGAVVSPADHLRLIDAALAQRESGAGELPATRALVAQYLLLYETGDPETLAPYVSEQSNRVQILVRLAHGPSRRLRAFVERLETALPGLAPAPLRARVTGTGLLRLETNDEFADGLFRNLLIASLAIAALLAVVLGSAGLGVLALVPNLLPILFVYGVLGWLGIPLNAATVTTGAAALGNAVDDTVQYLDRYRRQRQAGGGALAAREQTLLVVGTPMIASDVVLAAGFCAFLFSRFFPVASLGLLGAAAMALSLIANLFVLPAGVGVIERTARRSPP
jgi:predicted RND superfamily exporter protein